MLRPAGVLPPRTGFPSARLALNGPKRKPAAARPAPNAPSLVDNAVERQDEPKSSRKRLDAAPLCEAANVEGEAGGADAGTAAAGLRVNPVCETTQGHRRRDAQDRRARRGAAHSSRSQ